MASSGEEVIGISREAGCHADACLSITTEGLEMRHGGWQQEGEAREEEEEEEEEA